jgi:hypothetical protein
MFLKNFLSTYPRKAQYERIKGLHLDAFLPNKERNFMCHEICSSYVLIERESQTEPLCFFSNPANR